MSDILKSIKILNSRFVDKTKNAETATGFEKSILVVQIYKNMAKR